MNKYLKQSARVVLNVLVAILILIVLGRLIDSSLFRWSSAKLVVIGWWLVTGIASWWLAGVSIRLWLSLPYETPISVWIRGIFAIPFWFGLVSIVIWLGLAPS